MGAGLRTTLIAIAGCILSACSGGGTGATTTTSSGGTSGGTMLSGLDGGAPCADAGECASTACFGGRCCNDPCPVADPACAATGCDETGMCIYPGPSLSCGTPSCQGPISLSQRVCDGNGDCVLGTPNRCPTNYACDPTKSECNQVCQTDLDCDTTIAFCDPTGACTPKLPAGSPCLESLACASRTCLGGYCCAEQFCPPAPETNCQANGCNYDGGGCLYPSCADGLGCGIQGGPTCLTKCGTSADCVSGTACDPSTGLCCPSLLPGTDFYVDGFAGIDNGCCGSSVAPCQTLTRAMDRLASAAPGGVTGATIHAFNSNHGPDWTAPERWPIHLGLGVTLIAPSLYFDVTNTSKGSAVFQVYGFSATDLAPVTAEGDPSQNGVFIHVGFSSSAAAGPPNAGAAFDCNRSLAVPLTLSNAWLAGASSAVSLGPRSALTVGPLPVTIGSNAGQRPDVAGAIGISCFGLPGQPAELSDQGTQALRIDCEATAISIGRDCAVGLLHAPTLGYAGSCTQTTGLLVSGGTQVYFGTVAEPGSIRGFYSSGVQLAASDAGAPVVTISADVAKNTTGAEIGAGYFASVGSSFWGNSLSGADVTGGFLAASASSFSSNSYGVTVTGGGVDLGGDGGVGSLLSCNAYVDLVDSETQVVGTERVAWDNWDADGGTPLVWRCTDAGMSALGCLCVSGGCPPDGGPPDPDAGPPPVYLPFGVDAVYFDYNPGTLDFDQGKQAQPACH